jgi:hypothetical protein
VPLFTQRLAARQEAAARARGENVDGLIDEAPGEFRQQLVYAINRAASWPVGEEWRVRNLHRYLIQEVRQHLREEYGVPVLAAATDDPGEDLAVFVLNAATTHQVMDVIDAVIRVFADQMTTHGLRDCAVNAATNFAHAVSQRMKQHKMAYDLVEFKVVEKRSEDFILRSSHQPSLFCTGEAVSQTLNDSTAMLLMNWPTAIGLTQSQMGAALLR